MNEGNARRSFMALGAAGMAAAGLVAIPARQAVAQAAPTSLLRTVLDRGRLIVGIGSTNAPWHFENEKGVLRSNPRNF